MSVILPQFEHSGTFKGRSKIAPGISSFNDVKDFGSYYIEDVTLFTGHPLESGSAFLLVYGKDKNTLMQTLTTVADGISYNRSFVVAWSAWSTSDPYKDKEVLKGPAVLSTMADNAYADVSIKGKSNLAIADINSLSPETPGTITDAQNFRIISCGKNLINITEGMEVTSNRHFTLNGLQPGKSITVTISQTLKSLNGNQSMSALHWLRFFDKQDVELSSSGISSIQFSAIGETKTESETKVIPAGCTKINIDISAYRGADSPTLITRYVQIEYGSVATPYEPYSGVEQQVNGPLRSVPDGTADTIDSGNLITRIGKITLTGDETNITEGDCTDVSKKRYLIPLSGASEAVPAGTVNKAMSSHFKLIGDTLTSSANRGFTVIQNAICVYDKGQSLADFKTFLKAQNTAGTPVTFYYVLQTPTTTPLRVLLKSYYKITNVYSTSPLSPELTVIFRSRAWADEYNMQNKAFADHNHDGRYYIKSDSDARYTKKAVGPADIDTCETGIYYSVRVETLKLDGTLICICDATSAYVSQLFIAWNGAMYTRVKQGGTWAGWVKQYTLTEATALAAGMLKNASGKTQNALGSLQVTAIDANTLTATGLYICLSNTTALNYPVAINGYLIVIGMNATHTLQLFADINNTGFYIRLQTNAVWNAWKNITEASGGSYAGPTAPANTKLLWIDTSVGGVMKYHNGTAWVPVKSTWG